MSGYNGRMATESRLPWIIFVILVALIVVPLAVWRIGEARRPVLREVRIVTATDADPVFREGLRRAAAGEEVRIAAALHLEKAGGSDLWIAPVDQLVIDGAPVEHLVSGEWPEEDRILRVFWFTIEGSYLGGDLTEENAGKLLGQRSYLAPEMGRGLLAKALPEVHNDDQINLGDDLFPVAGGRPGGFKSPCSAAHSRRRSTSLCQWRSTMVPDRDARISTTRSLPRSASKMTVSPSSTKRVPT